MGTVTNPDQFYKPTAGETGWDALDNATLQKIQDIINAHMGTVRDGSGLPSSTDPHPLYTGFRGLPAVLTGATSAARFAGGTVSGSPTTGTFAVGDFVIDETGLQWTCTVAGSPGTWIQIAKRTLDIEDYWKSVDGTDWTPAIQRIQAAFPAPLATKFNLRQTYQISAPFVLRAGDDLIGCGYDAEGGVDVKTIIKASVDMTTVVELNGRGSRARDLEISSGGHAVTNTLLVTGDEWRLRSVGAEATGGAGLYGMHIKGRRGTAFEIHAAVAPNAAGSRSIYLDACNDSMFFGIRPKGTPEVPLEVACNDSLIMEVHPNGDSTCLYSMLVRHGTNGVIHGVYPDQGGTQATIGFVADTTTGGASPGNTNNWWVSGITSLGNAAATPCVLWKADGAGKVVANIFVDKFMFAGGSMGASGLCDVQAVNGATLASQTELWIGDGIVIHADTGVTRPYVTNPPTGYLGLIIMPNGPSSTTRFKFMGSGYKHSHTVLTSQLAATVWTNMPAAVTELFGVVLHRWQDDLTLANKARIIVHMGSVLGLAGSKLILQYSDDLGVTWRNTDNGGGATGTLVAIDANASGITAGAWSELVRNSTHTPKGDVQWRIIGSGGDGVVDPTFAAITVEFDGGP